MSLENLSAFNFKNYGTLLKYDLFTTIFELAKNYAYIDPIPDGSIQIYTTYDTHESIISHENKQEILANFLQCKTKPLDAIAYLKVAADGPKADMLRCFVLTKATPVENNQFYGISILASSVIVFVSRGAFPAGDSLRGKTPLPRIVAQMIKDENAPKTEAQLLEQLCSFDTKHVQTKGIFNVQALRGWDPILVNRLNLGVAGHKPLKLAADMSNILPTTGNSFSRFLVQAHTDAKGGFYPALHPSDPTFSTKYRGFYQQALAAIYDDLTIPQGEKVLKLKSHAAFKNEKLFDPVEGGDGRIKLEMVPRLYRTWDRDQMRVDLGTAMSFSSGEYTPSNPVKIEGSKRTAQIDPNMGKPGSSSSSGKTGKVDIA